MTQEEFLARMLRQVRFLPDRAQIRAELSEHLADSRTYLMQSEGLTPKEAAAQAVARMGDPAALGKALDRAHHPALGWLWFASRIVCVLVCCTMGLYVLYAAVMMVGGSALAAIEYANPEFESPIVCEVAVNETRRFGPHRATVDAAYRLENGDVYVTFHSYTLGRKIWSLAMPHVTTAYEPQAGDTGSSFATSGLVTFGYVALHQPPAAELRLTVSWPGWEETEGGETVRVILPAREEAAV